MNNPYTISPLLKADSSAKNIFVNAIGWDYAAKLLSIDTRERMSAAKNQAFLIGQSTEVRLPGFKPAIVASVLAIELYIKCLLTTEHTVFDRIHDLSGLFEKISKTAKAEISVLFDVCFARVPDLVELKQVAKDTPREGDLTLNGTLKMCNKAFVEWRYYHEGIATASTPNPAPLLDALRRYFIEKNPSWVDCLEPLHEM